MTQLATAINDTAISRSIADPAVTALRDTRHPLMLRFNKKRDKASWYLVHYCRGKKGMHLLGRWPDVKTKDALAAVPAAQLKLNDGQAVGVDKFETVGQLLKWYRDRSLSEAVKSLARKKTIRSHINKHLVPKLGKVRMAELSKGLVDDLFFLPLQAEGLKASTIRHIFYTLKPAFKRAADLEYISVNPMMAVLFGQHISKRIKPKDAALLPSDRDRLLDQVAELPWPRRIFVLFMLMFGTRIGETRQLSWRHIMLDQRRIIIPAELTKTEESHVLPLTEQAFQLLSAHRSTTDGEFLFDQAGRGWTEAQAQYQIRLASLKQWAAHDQRKFARSAWAELGIDYWVSERLINHKPKGLDAVYIRASALDVKLAALETYHNWLFATGTTQVLAK